MRTPGRRAPLVLAERTTAAPVRARRVRAAATEGEPHWEAPVPVAQPVPKVQVGGTSGTGAMAGTGAIGGQGAVVGEPAPQEPGTSTAGAGGSTAGTGGTGTAGAAGTGGAATGTPPSCQGLGDLCGGGSCCEAPLVPAGSFMMGSDAAGAPPDRKPIHSVSVSSFRMDKYEVTVGRFRRFVEVYPGSLPKAGDGAHPKISGSGWQDVWATKVPSSRAALEGSCLSGQCTWTNTAGANESLPINGVNWYVAFAFCAWDGGRLPTEAEWEYVATPPGDPKPYYPWGFLAPDCNLANIHPNGTSQCASAPLAVDGRPAGAGSYGQVDLAGNVSEWVLDWFDPDWYQNGGNTCADCANLAPVSVDMKEPTKVRRGAAFSYGASAAINSWREALYPTYALDLTGFRCARDIL
ncbi:MAG: formylglycine-generating enzyme family protein [Polyangiaceae bacterium]